jgi:hypothetical protein
MTLGCHGLKAHYELLKLTTANPRKQPELSANSIHASQRYSYVPMAPSPPPPPSRPGFVDDITSSIERGVYPLVAAVGVDAHIVQPHPRVRAVELRLEVHGALRPAIGTRQLDPAGRWHNITYVYQAAVTGRFSFEQTLNIRRWLRQAGFLLSIHYK